jgi:hypothetical protein
MTAAGEGKGRAVPLKRGRKNIGKNYKEMRRAGYKKSAALAAALRAAGVPKGRKKKRKR